MSEMKVEAPEKKKVRKARIQIQKKTGPVFQREEGGMDYNIWYHKHIGSKRERFGAEVDPATSRCSISKDAGWTVGCTQKDPYFCLYFARGQCTQGPDCKFMHRLPTKQDESRIPITKDCFGRDKHSTDRQDMSGVGNFNREGKSLFVTNLKNLTEVDMSNAVAKHFKEWGKLEYVRVFPERCYAFVKYELRLCSEFGKEAMDRQALDNAEAISIKWATDDSNQMAQAREVTEKRQKLISSLEEKGIETKQLPFNYPQDYNVPDTKIPDNLQTNVQTEEKPEIKPMEEKKEDLDYFHYIHGSFRDQKLKEKELEEREKKTELQKESLNSNVSEPYPETNAQYQNFYSQFYQQIGKQPNEELTQEEYQKYIDFYYSVDPVTYQQYQK